MAQNILWKNTIQVDGGLNISFVRSIEVEAYDSISVEIEGSDDDEGADSGKEIEIQPGEDAGQVKFIAIISDRYDENLTYKVNDNEVATSAHELNQPHVLAGEGAVGIMDAAPQSLFFTSGIAENANVSILVGRDATP